MKSSGSSDSAGKLTNYYPWWLDNLADDVTGEGAAIEGTLHGAEEVRKLVLDGTLVTTAASSGRRPRVKHRNKQQQNTKR